MRQAAVAKPAELPEDERVAADDAGLSCLVLIARLHDLPAAPPLLLHWLFGLPLLTWTVRSDDERRRAAAYADQIIFEGWRP